MSISVPPYPPSTLSPRPPPPPPTPPPSELSFFICLLLYSCCDVGQGWGEGRLKIRQDRTLCAWACTSGARVCLCVSVCVCACSSSCVSVCVHVDSRICISRYCTKLMVAAFKHTATLCLCSIKHCVCYIF